MRLNLELPSGPETILVDPHEEQVPLTRILRQNNHPLNTRCGERDLCHGCSVELLSGSLATLEGNRVDASSGAQLLRACRLKMAGTDATIRIPKRSLLAYHPQILTQFELNIPYSSLPICDPGLAVAVDVGTTTVVVLVVDPRSGEVLGSASAFNRQLHLGDDVLTRINLCATDPAMVRTLHLAVVEETLWPLLHEALCRAGRHLEEVGAFLFSGNTTMLHLLADQDPSPMGFAPFPAPFLDHRVHRAEELGLRPAGAECHLMPGSAAYVGADICCGVVASGLMYDEGPSLLVDVGTNGEIVLRHGDRLLGCATAAGPAFEGSGLSHGVRAGEGAISGVKLDAEPFRVSTEVIGGSVPVTGLCGSAYVDVLGQGVRIGLLGASGRLDRTWAARHPDSFVQTAYGLGLVVAHGPGKQPVVVSESDVALLLQAKAAIAAGIVTLLEHVGMTASDVATLYLAGGFGMHLNLDNAFLCGLLPGFRKEQVRLVGNTSLGGAYLAAVDRSMIDEFSRAASTMKTVELNLVPGFEDTYIDHLALPVL